jgi:hypothetical protein
MKKHLKLGEGAEVENDGASIHPSSQHGKPTTHVKSGPKAWYSLASGCKHVINNAIALAAITRRHPKYRMNGNRIGYNV